MPQRSIPVACTQAQRSQVSLTHDFYCPDVLQTYHSSWPVGVSLLKAVDFLNPDAAPVALMEFSVTSSIHEFVADVSITLNYENVEKIPLDVIFVFPINEDYTIYGFEALVDGKKIVAELQDRMKVLGMRSLSLLSHFLNECSLGLYQMQPFICAGAECSSLYYFNCHLP